MANESFIPTTVKGSSDKSSMTIIIMTLSVDLRKAANKSYLMTLMKAIKSKTAAA